MRGHLRIARPAGDLEVVAGMYREGLGFEELGRFAGHDGFDGVMLGHPDAGYHLEFTAGPGHPTPPVPSPESLLVFYVPAEEDWAAACDRARAAGFVPAVAANPYWDRRGRTFEDPDGYRVVLQRDAWPG